MSHRTANCPFFFFSFFFFWNLSFGGSGSVPLRPRLPRGPALCWRCDGDSEFVSSVLPARLYVDQNRPGWDMRNLGRDGFLGPHSTKQKRRQCWDAWRQPHPQPPPLTFLHYSFFPSRTPPHMLCPTGKKGGHVFRCVLSKKSNGSTSRLGFPAPPQAVAEILPGDA